MAGNTARGIQEINESTSLSCAPIVPPRTDGGIQVRARLRSPQRSLDSFPISQDDDPGSGLPSGSAIRQYLRFAKGSPIASRSTWLILSSRNHGRDPPLLVWRHAKAVSTAPIASPDQALLRTGSSEGNQAPETFCNRAGNVLYDSPSQQHVYRGGRITRTPKETGARSRSRFRIGIP